MDSGSSDFLWNYLALLQILIPVDNFKPWFWTPRALCLSLTVPAPLRFLDGCFAFSAALRFWDLRPASLCNNSKPFRTSLEDISSELFQSRVSSEMISLLDLVPSLSSTNMICQYFMYDPMKCPGMFAFDRIWLVRFCTIPGCLTRPMLFQNGGWTLMQPFTTFTRLLRKDPLFQQDEYTQNAGR